MTEFILCPLAQRVAAESHEAMLSKNKPVRDILVLLDADIKRFGDTTDALVIKRILSFVKNAKFILEQKIDDTTRASTENEITILKNYLPGEFSGPALKEAVHAFMLETPGGGMREMGRVMKSLNTMVAARQLVIDGKEVKRYVQECIDEH